MALSGPMATSAPVESEPPVSRAWINVEPGLVPNVGSGEPSMLEKRASRTADRLSVDHADPTASSLLLGRTTRRDTPLYFPTGACEEPEMNVPALVPYPVATRPLLVTFVMASSRSVRVAGLAS